MALREIESTLPPGFRFYPSDEELVWHYLRKKVTNECIAQGTLVEVDLHAREPWELPEVAKLTATEWYFFSFRDRKYATGSRTNRATKTGYWKATGKDREVRSAARGGAVVGMRKTLVFYRGRAPNGVKSGWVMHEFRLDNPHSPPREDWVLCRVFQKTKGDGGQDGDGDSSSSAFAGASHAMTEPDHYSAASSGGYYDLAFAPPQQEAAPAAVLPQSSYYGGRVMGGDHHHDGFVTRDNEVSAAWPGLGTMREVDGGAYAFGYFNMSGFDDDMAGLGGEMEFPQVWS